MSELAAAETLDLGIVSTGPCLRTEPPVLISERSVSLWLSRVICLSGNRTHLISHPAGQCEHLCNVGTPDVSGGLRFAHGGRSPTANMASDLFCWPV